jgi:hypothetical protein
MKGRDPNPKPLKRRGTEDAGELKKEDQALRKLVLGTGAGQKQKQAKPNQRGKAGGRKTFASEKRKKHQQPRSL